MAAYRAPYYRPKESKRVAYCKYHKWDLSVAQIKNYGCFHKKREGSWCCYFRPNLKHVYWVDRKIPEHTYAKN